MPANSTPPAFAPGTQTTSPAVASPNPTAHTMVGFVIRQLVLSGGGALVGYGWVTQDELGQIAGGVAAAAVFIWALAVKFRERRKLIAAADTGRVPK